MFAVGGSDTIMLYHDVAKVNLKSKTLLIVKTDPPGPGPDAKEISTNLGARIVFMEFNRPFLDSLHNNCTVSLYIHPGIIATACQVLTRSPDLFEIVWQHLYGFYRV